MDNKKEEGQNIAEKLARKGLNYATGGSWDAVRKAPLVGKAAQGLERKVGNIVPKQMGRYGGNQQKDNNNQKPVGSNNMQKSNNQTKKDNSTKKNDVASRRIQNALSNRGRNNLFSRTKKVNNNDNNGDVENSVTNSLDDELGQIKRRIKRKIIIALISFLLPIVGFVLVILVIVSISQSFFSFLIPKGLKENKIVIEDNNFSDDQIKYYDKLSELAKKFEDKCKDETLNTNIIHSVIIYYYYQLSDGDEDYSKMNTMLDTVYNALPNSCGVDYSVDGTFFNNLKNNSTFQNYYQKILVDKTMDDALKEAFRLGGEIEVDDNADTKTFVAEDATVSTKNENMELKSYLSGVVYANINNNDLSNNERIKALAIASTSNILAKNNMSLSTGNIPLNNTLDFNYCSVTEGCSYVNKTLVSGSGNGGNGNNVFNNGGYYYKTPLNSSVLATLNNSVNDIYGNVLVDKDGNYVTVDLSKISTASGSTFKEIISNAYGDVTIKNIRENVYIDGVNFGYEKVLTDVIFYDQKDYNNVSFCGLKHSIGEWGCGITSMAMIISTYENDKKYDPVYTMNQAYKWGQCGSGVSGTSISYFRKQANAMGYHYLNVNKKSISDKNLVLSHLSQGHLVVIHVLGPNIFTGGGHYMVLSGIDPDTGKVYVNDPNSRSNKNNKSRKSGNGWYSFNDVVVPAGHSGNKPFHIIWKD